jgi:hypothetical protein
MEEALAPGPNFNRPVKDLVHKDLLTSTFTQSSHDRGIKTWRASVSYPQCVFCGNIIETRLIDEKFVSVMGESRCDLDSMM